VRTLACFVGISALLGLLPSLVAQRFDDVGAAGARHLGWFLSCYGVGSVLGSLNIARFSRRWSRDQLILIGTLASGIAMLAIVYGMSSASMSIAMLAAGMAWAVALTSINIEAQLILPKHLLARGLSISLMALMVALTAGSILWGAVATHWTIVGALGAAAIVTIIAALAQWFVRRSV
ncbi:MAG TPA: MFS transporter, partial [Steroidobacteraceae bacterium]|nr:MFS transporter [Steroidobacteraceae bacterium]